jgi:hypothetical protein
MKAIPINKYEILTVLERLPFHTGKSNLAEVDGHTLQGKKAFTPKQQKIQELEKQLWQARMDNEILKNV